MKILESAFNSMPNVFTSNEFTKAAIKMGYPKRVIKRRGLANYLHKRADNQYHGSKTWVKKNGSNNVKQGADGFKKDTDHENNNVDYMIKHLKSLGYKILKPVSEWEEC